MTTRPVHQQRITAYALTYVAVVLLVDMLASNALPFPQWCYAIPWHYLRWHLPNQVDLFKLIFWFIIPFCVCIPGMAWGYLGISRCKRLDWFFLAGMIGIGVLVMAVIPLFPELRRTYPSLSTLPAAVKWHFLYVQLAWTFSWLVGWEFMHRYVLLRRLDISLPGYGWLLIPIYEGVYHLQKDWPETVGMVVFSLAMTWWAHKRQNMLLPFLAHLIIEVELILFLILV